MSSRTLLDRLLSGFQLIVQFGVHRVDLLVQETSDSVACGGDLVWRGDRGAATGVVLGRILGFGLWLGFGLRLGLRLGLVDG